MDDYVSYICLLSKEAREKGKLEDSHFIRYLKEKIIPEKEIFDDLRVMSAIHRFVLLCLICFFSFCSLHIFFIDILFWLEMKFLPLNWWKKQKKCGGRKQKRPERGWGGLNGKEIREE